MNEIQKWAEKVLDKRYLANPVSDWLLALTILLGAWIVFALLKRLLRRRIRQMADGTAENVQDIAWATLNETGWFFSTVFGIYLAAKVLTISKAVSEGLELALMLAVLVQLGVWAQAAIHCAVSRWRQNDVDPSRSTMAAAVGFVTKLVVWVVVLLVVLSNFGVEISTLVAGLGIGGVAAALAVQSLLSDTFASLSMYFDRPFDIGDFIIVDDYLGTVDKIGVRSTRMRSLDGEQVIFSNSDLLQSRIRNYRRMYERRVLFQVGIEYNLPPEKVELVPIILRERVEQVPGVRFERAHFKAYGDFSLVFEAVYYVLSANYNVYMDKQQQVNFGVYRGFAEAKVPFAFPTRTLHLRSQSASLNDVSGEARPGNGASDATRSDGHSALIQVP